MEDRHPLNHGVNLNGVNVAGGDVYIDKQDIHLPSTIPPPSTNLFQLPPDIADFVGRDTVLAEIRRTLGRVPSDGTTATSRVAIVGRAGVGKTTLAVRAAHQLRMRFPEGQLYVNLRGVEAQRLRPGDVLSDFLRALGTEGSNIPQTTDARAAMFRGLLRDRRLLVVLDNAAGPAQVRDLLPSDPNNGVLLTSRRHMAALGGTHDIYLDGLRTDTGIGLLARIVGAERVAADEAAASSIVRLCDGLPLAIRIVGARLAGRPGLSLARLAERLSDERRVLDELSVADLDIRAGLTLSYQSQSADQQRAFRRLGLFRAPDFTSWRLAALLNCTVAEAERLIDDMVGTQLIGEGVEDELGQERFRFHDLPRAFARERAEEEEPEDVRRAALERVGNSFLVIARYAADRLEPGDVVASDDSRALATSEVSDNLRERVLGDPLTWFEVERPGLVVAVQHAADAGAWDLAWKLANTLYTFFDLRSYWNDWGLTHDLALQAAREAGNLYGEAVTLRYLGRLHRYTGDITAAISCLSDSAEILRRLNRPHDEARTLVDIVRTMWFARRWDEGLEAFARGRTLFRQAQDRHGEARILHSVGLIHRACGRWTEALEVIQWGEPVFREAGDTRWLAACLWSLGDVHRDLGHWLAAKSSFEEALKLLRSQGNRWWEAVTLRSLGALYRDHGHWTEARGCFEVALPVLQESTNEWWEGVLRTDFAEVDRAEGRLDTARKHLERSAAIFRNAADSRWLAITECGMAAVHIEDSRWEDAIVLAQRCLKTFRSIDDEYWQAQALSTLGVIHARTGRTRQAHDHWREALDIFTQLRSWKADNVASLLRG